MADCYVLNLQALVVFLWYPDKYCSCIHCFFETITESYDLPSRCLQEIEFEWESFHLLAGICSKRERRHHGMISGWNFEYHLYVLSHTYRKFSIRYFEGSFISKFWCLAIRKVILFFLTFQEINNSKFNFHPEVMKFHSMFNFLVDLMSSLWTI